MADDEKKKERREISDFVVEVQPSSVIRGPSSGWALVQLMKDYVTHPLNHPRIYVTVP
jgi:hypothetical protein